MRCVRYNNPELYREDANNSQILQGLITDNNLSGTNSLYADGDGALLVYTVGVAADTSDPTGPADYWVKLTSTGVGATTGYNLTFGVDLV